MGLHWRSHVFVECFSENLIAWNKHVRKHFQEEEMVTEAIGRSGDVVGCEDLCWLAEARK